MSALDTQAIARQFMAVQDEICQGLEAADGSACFREDAWQRAAGGGGRTRVLSSGGVFEQVGVNFSHVHGERLPQAASARRPELAGRSFQALGVSLVAHPENPFIPSSHFNIRFFVAEAPAVEPVWWFGGGFDLTPYYGFEDDAVHWHRMACSACEPYGGDVYPRFKAWCDDYFFLRHRNEPRGIGGLFFDDLNEWGLDSTLAFVLRVAEHYMLGYRPIIARRRDTPFGRRERDFQRYRRGRYVEFNLIYDRGTLFGLQSGGRTESILMSLPPEVSWRYGYVAEPGSPEEALTRDFLVVRDWLGPSLTGH